MGGFGSGDDLSFVDKYLVDVDTIDGIKEMILNGGPESFSRPVSSAILVVSHIFFKDNPSLYIATGIITWLISVGCICYVLKHFLINSSLYIFVLLASFPFFTATIFSGPYLFSEYIVSIMIWSISLVFMLSYAKHKIRINYFIGLILLMVALLTLSYILPLLLVTATLPVLYEYLHSSDFNDKILMRNISKYTLPVLIISLFFFIFYVNIGNLYTKSIDIYGLEPISIKSFLQAAYYCMTIIIEVLLMLIEVLPHLLRWKVLIIGVLIIWFYIVLRTHQKKDIQRNNKEKLFIYICICSLLFASSIFFISLYPSSTFGFYNRMMLPSFIMYSVLISWLFSNLLRTRWYFIPVTLSILWISSMIVQLDNFVQSWEMRENIAKEIAIELNNSDLGDTPILIANMPYFLNNNYNNEEVTFCTWSFDAHLKFAGAPNIGTWPICYRIVSDPTFYPNHNILNRFSSISDDANIWYYEYEEGDKNGILIKLGNKQALLQKFEEIKLNKINYHPIILREKIRIAFKNLPMIESIYKKQLPIDLSKNI